MSASRLFGGKPVAVTVDLVHRTAGLVGSICSGLQSETFVAGVMLAAGPPPAPVAAVARKPRPPTTRASRPRSVTTRLARRLTDRCMADVAPGRCRLGSGQ